MQKHSNMLSSLAACIICNTVMSALPDMHMHYTDMHMHYKCRVCRHISQIPVLQKIIIH